MQWLLLNAGGLMTPARTLPRRDARDLRPQSRLGEGYGDLHSCLETPTESAGPGAAAVGNGRSNLAANTLNCLFDSSSDNTSYSREFFSCAFSVLCPSLPLSTSLSCRFSTSAKHHCVFNIQTRATSMREDCFCRGTKILIWGLLFFFFLKNIKLHNNYTTQTETCSSGF